MALPQNLLTVTVADLAQLVADQTSEGPHIEFKRDLPVHWNAEARQEFLADVSAFANAGGGDLIYGVDENGNGQAGQLVPQVVQNIDQDVRRLQDFLRDLVEPRLPGVQIHPVPVEGPGARQYIIVVRVPQSWAGPHRVNTNQHFYIREGGRKRQLNVPEIRGLILRSETQVQRVRDFRTERLGKILSGAAPHRLVDGPTLVVHLIPSQAALGLVQIDPVVYTTRRRAPVLGTTAGMARLNIDGALTVRNPGAQGTHGYTQVFRNGFIETVMVIGSAQDMQRALLPTLRYEQQLNAFLGEVRVELENLGIATELSVMLSILRANEVQFGTHRDLDFLDDHQGFFDRETIVLPDVLTKGDMPVELAMKPVFDLVWQSAGFNGSRNYNTAGEWAPLR